MKQLLIITCIFGISLSGLAQQKRNIIDSASVRLFYLFTKKMDSNLKTVRADTLVLDIGTKFSKFYDPARLGRDSILKSKMDMDPSTIKSVSVYKEEKANGLIKMNGTAMSNPTEGESYQIIKDKRENKIIVLDYGSALGARFKYEEELGTLPWKILEEMDTVLSYSCQKATLNFRGRDYVAWFTTDVPLSDGPWKFSGLPGLVLKVEDTNGLFSFKLIGLHQATVPFAILMDDTKSIKCTRAELEKQKSKQRGELMINENGGHIIIAESPAKFKYTAMEME